MESSWGGGGVRLTTSPPSVSRLSTDDVGASTSDNPMGLHGRFYFCLVCEAIGTAATPSLLCQPRVIVKMIVEKQMECRLAGETEGLGENLPQRHFCPSQNLTWPDPGFNPGLRGFTAYYRDSFLYRLLFIFNSQEVFGQAERADTTHNAEHLFSEPVLS
jgi:hypothetical protein